jgi:hypothetical protein
MKHHLYARLHELRFAGKKNLTNITWLAHLYVATKLLDPDAPVWPDMEFVLARQGSDHLFDGPAPTTLAGSLCKLKEGAGVTNIGTSAEGIGNPSKARIIRSPRGVGNILSGRIDPLAKQKDGTIYRVLRTFILDPANQAHLRAQLNLPLTSPLNLTHKSEPRYATLLYDLGMHWLPADLADLYFD